MRSRSREAASSCRRFWNASAPRAPMMVTSRHPWMATVSSSSPACPCSTIAAPSSEAENAAAASIGTGSVSLSRSSVATPPTSSRQRPTGSSPSGTSARPNLSVSAASTWINGPGRVPCLGTNMVSRSSSALAPTTTWRFSMRDGSTRPASRSATGMRSIAVTSIE